MSGPGWEHVRTVGQLRTALSAMPDDMPVVLAKDGEGNDYSPLSAEDNAVELAYYEPESTWSGARIDDDATPPATAFLALFLWPVN